MVIPASSAKVARNVAVAAFAAPLVLLSACSPPNESPSTATGTQPPVWTGAPESSSSSEPGGPETPESLTVHLKAPDGTQVATAKFEFDADPGGKSFVTVTIESAAPGLLSPGFHGVHLHEIAKCEADSKAPNGQGAPGDFLSAGGHFHAAGHGTEPASGDLTSLQVRSDGAALLVTTTDAFTKEDLVGGDGTAIIIHSGPDNFANIPKDRYTQVNGTPGPDETTLATGDSGKRVACGEIKAG